MEIENWEQTILAVDTKCERLRRLLTQRLPEDVIASILHGFLQTGMNTLRGETLLFKNHLPGEALILARVLIETRITLEYWLKMFRQDKQGAVKRYFDGLILEKIRQMRASKFAGADLVPGAVTNDRADEIERELEGRYGRDEMKRIRQNGFSGISVADRATALGLDDLYNIAYRNLSRNVHGGDFAAQLKAAGFNPSVNDAEYFDLRDRVAVSASIESLMTIALNIDHAGTFGMKRELAEALAGSRGHEGWVQTP